MYETDSNYVRVCATAKCHVVTYQIMSYPGKINQACPSCGKIGVKKPL